MNYTVGAIAVFFLAITFWPRIQTRLGKAFLPLLIVLICALPIIANQIAIRFLFSGVLPPPEALLTRALPFLLIALILIAWQYKWQHILVFAIVIAALNIGVLLAFAADNQGSFSAGLFAIITQVVSFLVVGFFINIIVGWLNTQRRALEEANLKLTHYAQTLEDLAITKERNRIAQELHDTLSHTLSGLSVQLETMKAYWDVDPVTARKMLDKSLTATRSGLEETRRVLMALRARPLEELGLAMALRQMAEDAAAHAGITLDLMIAENIPVQSPGVEQCIYRIAQEAITNTLKHANAKNLTVKLAFTENKVALMVQDDGKGFNVNDTGDIAHFGLQGMKERAAFSGAELKISSRPGTGTIVQLTI